MQEKYDITIVGAGVSALTLAFCLHQKFGDSVSVRILDDEQKRDFNLSYWTESPNEFSQLSRIRIDKVETIHLNGKALLQHSNRYHYESFRFSEFKKFVLGNVPYQLERQKVEDVQQLLESSQLVFDSRRDFEAEKDSFLIQHFLGYEIRTNSEVFDTTKITLMDFRPRLSNLSFAYVIRFAANHALIEIVSCSPITEADLQDYIAHSLGVSEYEVVHKERGATPLTTAKADRNPRKGIYNLGVRGGMAKPSSGYAFSRILKDSRAIAGSINPTSLRESNIKFYQQPRLYRGYDWLMLNTIKHLPRMYPDVFYYLFKTNEIGALLEFLDEESSLPKLAKLTANLTPGIVRTIL